jgi:hypothetical protein
LDKIVSGDGFGIKICSLFLHTGLNDTMTQNTRCSDFTPCFALDTVLVIFDDTIKVQQITLDNQEG